jgi:hypothetical protein
MEKEQMGQQNEKDAKRAGRRAGLSLDQQIAEAMKRVEALRDRKKAEDKAALEKNRKAISDLFKVERLDTVDVEMWRKELVKVKALLGLTAESDGDPTSATGAAKEVPPAVPPSKRAGKSEAQPVA